MTDPMAAQIADGLLTGAFDEAIALAEAFDRRGLARDDPDRVSVRRTHVRLLLRSGRVEEAREIARRLSDEVADGSPRARFTGLLAQSDVTRERGELRRFRELRAEARRVAVESGDPALGTDGRLQWAQVLTEQGDLPGALEELAAVGREPAFTSHPAYLRACARVHLRLGELGPAEDAFRRLGGSGVPIECAQSAMGLAEVLLRKGRPDDALAVLRPTLAELDRLSARFETIGHLWNLVGEAARAAGRLDEAEVAYGEALIRYRVVSPADQPVARVNLVLVQLARGRVEEAARELASPDLGNDQLHLALVVRLVVALARAACAAYAGQGAAFDAAFQPFASGWRGALVDADLAWLASLTALACERRGPSAPWLVRSARARRIAWWQCSRLGRTADVAREERALRRLASAGAPTLVGAFTLERRLGAGGFGDVWSASHLSGLPVAIKVLRAADARAEEMLRNELRAVAALDHPSIVRLFDHGTIDPVATTMDPNLGAGTPWMATELAIGGTLAPLLGRIGWDEARRIVLGLLDGLAHAHARGVLHLDVKPANVLLGGDDGRRPRLADFGLAVTRTERPSQTSGTPHYMAPEQFTAPASTWGPHTDLYALGCVTVALVSGAPPFGGTTLDVLRDAHLTSEPRLAPVCPVPDGFVAWVRRMLAKDPAARFRFAADAARALLALGPASERPGVAPLPREEADPETMALPLDELRVGIPATPSSEAEGCPVLPPLVPVRWQRGPAAGLRPNDAGLALFGLRVPPFVGREHERSLLWAVLRDVSTRGRARAAVIEAPSGLGATALASWFGERAHEVGAAHVHVGGHLLDEPASDRATIVLLDGAAAAPVAMALLDRYADRPVLVVWTVREPCLEAEPLLDREGVVPVTLGALPPAEQLALVEALLPLEPELASRVAAHTAASPRFAVQLLTDWVGRGWLDGHAGRFGLRFELPRWPDTLAALMRDRVAAPLAAASRDERKALAVAAALGPTAGAEAWAEACAAAGVPVAPAVVGRWMELGLAVRLSGGGFRFADDTVRDAVLAGRASSG